MSAVVGVKFLYSWTVKVIKVIINPGGQNMQVRITIFFYHMFCIIIIAMCSYLQGAWLYIGCINIAD